MDSMSMDFLQNALHRKKYKNKRGEKAILYFSILKVF